MLQRDYLIEVIVEFVDAVTQALRMAHAADDVPSALEAAGELEQDVAGLLDLDPTIAMNLTPDSLVTMIMLSGIGDALSEYVAFALDHVADVYDSVGSDKLAILRHEQAVAIAESFGCDLTKPPAEFSSLAAELAK